MEPVAKEPDAHVVFELTIEDGWPPVGSERLWAFHLGDDRYRIDNVPWFVRDLAVADVVRAHVPNPDSNPVFDEVLERSDHVTIRLICFRSGPLGGDLARALEPFTALGVYGEGVTQYGMVALDIEAKAPLAAIAVASAEVLMTVPGSTRKAGSRKLGSPRRKGNRAHTSAAGGYGNCLEASAHQRDAFTGYAADG